MKRLDGLMMLSHSVISPLSVLCPVTRASNESWILCFISRLELARGREVKDGRLHVLAMYVGERR